MKTGAKIIAYGIWFGFTFWLVFLGFRLMSWAEFDRFGPFFFVVLSLFLWFGFIFLLTWFPIWLIKKRIPNFTKLTAKVAVYVILLLACIILSEIFWDSFFAGRIYNCTDDNLGGFLQPGDWVHSHGGMPVAVVPQIPPHETMDKPDSLKEGWSIPKLWFLWWIFAFASVAISAALTFLIFRSRKKMSS